MTLYRIQERRDTAANWTAANPVLEDGQWGIELGTGKAKLGTGSKAWNDLPYFVNEVEAQEMVDALGASYLLLEGYQDEGDIPADFPINSALFRKVVVSPQLPATVTMSGSNTFGVNTAIVITQEVPSDPLVMSGVNTLSLTPATSVADLSSAILARGPLVYFKFIQNATDGTSSTTQDYSGNSRNGTTNANVYRREQLAKGGSPYSIRDNGDDSRTFINHASWMDEVAQTHVVLFRPAQVRQGTPMGIADNYVNDSTDTWFALQKPNNTFETFVRGASGATGINSGNNARYRQDMPILMSTSFSAAGHELYINGRLVGSVSGIVPAVSTGALRVQCGSLSGIPANGNYSDYAMFNYHFTAADHMALAEATFKTWANTGSLTVPRWWRSFGDTPNQAALPSGSSGKSASAGRYWLARCDTIPSPFETSDPQAIEFWFQKPSAAVNGSMAQIGTIGLNGWGIGIGGSDFGNAGHNLIFLRETIAWHIIGALTTGIHHCVVNRNGSTFEVYIDNSLVWNTNPGSVVAPVLGDGVNFGGYLTDARVLSSAVPMDKIAMYDKVLTSARVSAHYNGGAGSDSAVAADAPIVLLELDETS